MNTVVIIGHPSSGLEHVEDLMRRCGMQHARPSRREGMTPHDIAKALIKAYQCEPVDVVTDEDAFKPLQVGPVWHGMALDLLLGNLEQPFWGWSDPSAIYLLDYWRTLEPSMVFVLVYDHPRRALQTLASKGANSKAGATDVQNVLDNWAAYNAALLTFHLRHPGCSMLVSTEQVCSATENYLEELAQKLRRPLKLDFTVERLSAELIGFSKPLLPISKLLEGAGHQSSDQGDGLGLEDFVIDGLLSQFPQVMQLFAGMQSAASFAAVEKSRQVVSPMHAWESLLLCRSMLLEYGGSGKSSGDTELQEENGLLLNQLHRVQEELERYYLENQALKQGGKKAPRPKLYGAADRVKRQLTYRLGAKVVAHSKTFTGIFQLLPALLSEVIVFRREKELRTGEKLPPISQYADAHEAERVRQHLSYRLGHVLIETARKPYKWPLLPFTLLSETKAWRHERGRA